MDEHRISERRQQVSEMYLAGRTQSEIAQKVGCDQSLVSLDLKTLRQQWQEDARRSFGERQAEELARIDQAEREAWDAWQRSKRDAETVQERQETDAQGTKQVRSKTRKGQVGDARFLELVHKCIENRMKLFGYIEMEERIARLERKTK